MLQKELGCKPKFLLAGGNDTRGHKEALITAQLEYLKWLRKRVAYLPKYCPEQILLNALDPKAGQAVKNAQQAKDALRTLLAGNVSVSGSEMVVLAKVKVANIPDNNQDLGEIRDQLKFWLHS